MILNYTRFIRTSALLLCLLGVFPARAGSLAVGATLLLIDKEKVTDPATRDLLVKIERALAGVNDYTCLLKTTTNMNGKKAITRTELSFMRPDFARSMSKSDGNEVQYINDGKYCWQYVRNVAGSGRDMLETLNLGDKMTLEQKQQFIREHERLKIFKCDLVAMRKAGCPVRELCGYGRELRPLADCALETLTLESEGEGKIVLSAQQAVRNPAIASIRITLDEKTCLPISKEYLTPSGEALTKLDYTQTKTNTNPNERLFAYTPPQGITVTDNTASLIQLYRTKSESSGVRALKRPTPAEQVKGTGIYIKARPKPPAEGEGKGQGGGGGGYDDEDEDEGGQRGSSRGGGGGGGGKGGGRKR